MSRKTPTPLRNLRRARTLNQQQFARLIGVSQQTLSKYETGVLVPAPDVQAKIAAILGVSRRDVFAESEAVAS